METRDVRVTRVLASAAEIAASVTRRLRRREGLICVFDVPSAYTRQDSSGERDESRAQRHVIDRIGFASN